MLEWFFKSAGRSNAESSPASVAMQHHRAGRLAQAEAAYRGILADDPQNIDALHLLGVVAHQGGKHAQAAELITRSLSLNAANAAAHSNLGVVLAAQGKFTTAIASFRQALALQPGFADAYFGLGNALRDHGRREDAVACLQQALALKPDFAQAHCNLGIMLEDQGRSDEAIACYRKALALDRDFAPALANLGNSLIALGRLDEAEASLRQALRLLPDIAHAEFSLGQLKLLQGDYEAGFPLYEQRFEKNALSPFYSGLQGRMAAFQGAPRWRGENASGKTLLVWTEQGLGDNLMLLRYLPLLKGRGAARLIVYADSALVRLVQSIADVDEVIPRSRPLPFGQFDLHCPIMSLPLALGTRATTIPHKVPYVFVPEEIRQRWRQRLAGVATPRIGLAWSGGALYPKNPARSVRLEQFFPLLEIAGARFVSLQKGEQADQLKEMGPAMVDWMGECDDLVDTAALMAQLDLVITVDTAVAHLAGALGRPVWMLNRFESEWRWLLQREDSPWYPTMRIFRQRAAGRWDEVVARIAVELRGQIAAGRRLA